MPREAGMKHVFRKCIKTVLQLVLLFSFFIIPGAGHALQSDALPSGGTPELKTVYDENSVLLRKEPQAAFVADEIIVKFKTAASNAIRQKLDGELRIGGSEDTGVPSIQKLNAKHSIKHIEPVFKGLHRKLRTGKSLDDVYKEIERKYPERSKRAKHKDRNPDLSGIYKLKMPKGMSKNEMATIVSHYAKDPNVEYAELNYIRKAQFVPNDPFYSSSRSWGQHYEDMWGLIKMDMERAWDIARAAGGPSVIVAVVDSGTDYTHPDLSPNVWINSGEIPGNGIDDDGNGYIDDVRGWDFTTCQSFNLWGECLISKAPDNDPLDDHGHGTHVSGTIAAATNNGVGMAGIALNAKVLPAKGLNYQGGGTVSDLAEAVAYAADNGAGVQNYSWGGSGQSSTLHDAIQYAHDLGCVLVAAAGNDAGDIQYYSPAHLKEVITVASTDHNDIRSGFSNFGTMMDVAAPGGDSTSTGPLYPEINILSLRASGTDMYCSGSSGCGIMIVQDSYYRARGTSMAAPHVSGLAALLLSVNPSFTKEQVRQAIRGGSDDLGTPGFDEQYGFGRINAYRSLQISDPCTAWIEEPSYHAFLFDTVSVIGTASCGSFQGFRLEYGEGDRPLSYSVLVESNTPVTDGLLFSWNTGAVPTGNYTLRLTVTDSAGKVYQDKTLVRIHPALKNGWFYDIQNSFTAFSNPSFADIDNDGFKEVVVLNTFSRELYVFRHDGTMQPGWPISFAGSGELSNYFPPPAIGDIDGDGFLEIFVTTSIGIYGLDHTGNPLPGWPQATDRRFDGPPVLADLDEDGYLEVLAFSKTPYATTKPAYLYAWTRSGSPVNGFPVNAGRSTAFTSIAVGDLDPFTRGLEIVVAISDEQAGKGTVLGYDNQGVKIIDTVVPGLVNVGMLASLGDVNGDGYQEIVYFGKQGYPAQTHIGVLDFRGNPISQWIYTNDWVDLAPPLLGDLDNNGSLEIITKEEISNKILAWNYDGSLVPGFPIISPGDVHAPVLADVDGDGRADIVSLMRSTEGVIAFHGDSTLVPGLPISLYKWPDGLSMVLNFQAPAIDDIDNDGKLELTVAPASGVFFVLELPGSSSPARLDWPMPYHDLQRTCSLKSSGNPPIYLTDLAVSALVLPAAAGAGDTITATDTTANYGAGTAPGSVTAYYLSSNAAWDSGDIPLGSRTVPELSAGAANQGSASITIPPATPGGTWYIIAKADAYNAVTETNEANNTRAGSIAITGPDLTITAVDAPSTAQAGDTITITDTTANIGMGTSGASTTSFYLSTNTTYDNADVLLGSTTVGPLSAGANSQGTTSVTIPAGIAVGTYYIIAMADAAGTVAETNETNNTKATSAIKIGAELIGSDLTVTTVTAPTAAAAGGPITVAGTTTNNRPGTVAASTTRFYLSADPSLDGSDVALNGSRQVPALAAGGSSSGTTSALIPTGTPSGSYYVIAKADGDYFIPETSETNNTKYSTSIKIGPDLTVTAVAAPATAGAGKSISVTDTTQNSGAGSAAPSMTSFYLSTDSTLDQNDALLGSRSVDSIAAGVSSSGTASVLIPTGTPSGSYYVIARADAADMVAETREDNNTKYSTSIKIGPDLTMTAVAAPATAGAGKTTSVTDTTKNSGAGDTGPWMPLWREQAAPGQHP